LTGNVVLPALNPAIPETGANRTELTPDYLASGSPGFYPIEQKRMKIIALLISLMFCTGLSGQGLCKRALFLGNSYTAANNLPQMVADVAASAGDTLWFDSNTPGGYTLQGHSTNTISLGKIAAGGWDYVVLQEQSQLPSFPLPQVQQMVFPYARVLDSIINAGNNCAETVFYMTWGRKNGDAENCPVWPPVCTYEGMDSLLSLRYRMMAADNQAILSPVGSVWRYLRQNYPQLELYSPDGSHPSVAGTYAAACSFYTAFFRKDPASVSYNPGIPTAEAYVIRAAARAVVYDSLATWHIGTMDPSACFSYSHMGNGNVAFANHSENAESCYWEFGDGFTSLEENPIHTYTESGVYDVKLYALSCGLSDTAVQTLSVVILDARQEPAEGETVSIQPNPATTEIRVVSTKPLHRNRYSIMDAFGRVHKSGIFSTDNPLISIRNLKPGYYFLKMDERDWVRFVKL
jgi:hypothetical protein